MADWWWILKMPPCAREGCTRQGYRRGYCRPHNEEARASGELLPRGEQGCKEDGCTGKHKGLGWCQSHFNSYSHQKLRASASEAALPRVRELFNAVGWTVDDKGCWLWAGRTNAPGYGLIASNPISGLAHRISYSIHHGLVQRGEQVHHKCAVRLCVNPDHLQAVSAHNNTAEMLERREYKRRIAELEKEVARLTRELERVAA